MRITPTLLTLTLLALTHGAPLGPRQLPGIESAVDNTLIPTVQGTGTSALNEVGASAPQPVGGIVDGIHNNVAKPIVGTGIDATKGLLHTVAGGGLPVKKRQLPGIESAVDNSIIPTVQGTGTSALNEVGASAPQPVGGVVDGVHNTVKPVVGAGVDATKAVVGGGLPV
ncbi:hypothetical protein HK104_004132 [Borealophlyctis nickersoniae]|nr:hypothetical protein HK104_004132 [Borealophlyctis nickersoniae]